MKRTILFVVLAFCAITLISAQQGRDRWGRGNNPGERPRHNWGYDHQNRAPRMSAERPRHNWGYDQNRAPRMVSERVTVSGNLTIAGGMIAVNSNDITYLAVGLNRFTGFIEGFKEGALVSLEGHAMSAQRDNKTKFLRVQKMTLNGKEYDLDFPFQNMTPPPARDTRDHRNQRMMRGKM